MPRSKVFRGWRRSPAGAGSFGEIWMPAEEEHERTRTKLLPAQLPLVRAATIPGKCKKIGWERGQHEWWEKRIDPYGRWPLWVSEGCNRFVVRWVMMTYVRIMGFCTIRSRVRLFIRRCTPGLCITVCNHQSFQTGLWPVDRFMLLFWTTLPVTRQGPMIPFNRPATLLSSQCHQRAPVFFFTGKAFQVKTHHTLDTSVACPQLLILWTSPLHSRLATWTVAFPLSSS